MPTGPSRGPLPLVVGVTGHRDLRSEDTGRLETAVEGLLKDLQRRLPHTPLVLLSPLAEGADRLVARVALTLGIRLIAPLPLAKHLYEQDFETQSSLDEFRGLLARADHWFVLPLRAGCEEADLYRGGSARNEQYAQVGAYVARQSQVLLALWDGKPSPKVGGTACIVRFKLEGSPAPCVPGQAALGLPDEGPVFHLVTPRQSVPSPVETPFAVVKLWPQRYGGDAVEASAFERSCARTDMFNRDALRLGTGLARQSKSSSLLLETGALRLSADLQAVQHRFAIADGLALHFQKRTSHLLSAFLFLSFLVAVSLQLDEPPTAGPWTIGVYLAAVVMIAGLFLWAKRGGFESKYLDYRALAEGLRVQFFWGLAGITENVADHYLRMQQGELSWIRSALRAWLLPSKEEANNGALNSSEALRLVLEHWLADQHGYFSRAARRDWKRLTRLRRWAARLLWGGVAWAVVEILLRLQNPHKSVKDLLAANPTSRLDEYLVSLVIGLSLMMVGAGLLFGFLRISALDEHVKQYGRMSTVYGLARKRFGQAMNDQDEEEAKRIGRALGKEALIENGVWLSLHRERPLEMPEVTRFP